jgi:hypothetical protein
LRHSHNPPRHTKIGAKPLHGTEYYSKRKLSRAKKRLSGRFKTVWTRQGGICRLCGLPMDTREQNEIMTANVTISEGRATARRQVFARGHCSGLFQESRPKG